MKQIQIMKDALSSNIKNTFRNSPEGDFKIILNYATSIQGKMIRPLLLLTFLESNNEKWEDYVDVAVAIELVHMHSLIFDDMPMMDDDDMRRGQPTLHKKFNEYGAALAGLNLLTTAWKKINSAKIEPKLKVELADILINATNENGIMQGQYLDLKGGLNTKQEILDMYGLKTGVLIAAPILMGEKIINKNFIKINELSKTLGLAFQLQDDYLEVVMSSEQLGKPNDSDSSNDKKTFIYFNGLDKTRKEIDIYFTDIYEIITQNKMQNTSFHKLVEMVDNREQ